MLGPMLSCFVGGSYPKLCRYNIIVGWLADWRSGLGMPALRRGPFCTPRLACILYIDTVCSFGPPHSLVEEGILFRGNIMRSRRACPSAQALRGNGVFSALLLDPNVS